MATLREAGEWGLIRAVEAVLGRPAAGLVGIGDDAAVGAIGAGLQALTTVDLLVEGVHFRMGTSPRDLGHKAIAVNLSDLAAMGGRPRWAVIGLALPPELALGWVVELYQGMKAIADRYDLALVGGDTVGASGGVTIAVTVVGEAARPLLRSDARPGDVVFMTGPAGLSAAGLWCLAHPGAPVDPAARQLAEAAHRRPEPQVAAGLALAGLGCRVALMDNSDGLARSAIALATASGVAVELDAATFPCETATRKVAVVAGVEPASWVLDGGEDYGLVGSVARGDWPSVAKTLARSGHGATVVGAVAEGPTRALLRQHGAVKRLSDARGFGHFAT